MCYIRVVLKWSFKAVFLLALGHKRGFRVDSINSFPQVKDRKILTYYLIYVIF